VFRPLAAPVAVVLAAVAVLAAAGCGNPPADAGGRLTVFAAASLTESFTSLGEEFEAANRGIRVTFNFGASSALAQQIDQGAPADVFASANPANLERVAVAGEPRVFARNVLQIAVPKGNPAGVTGLADLGRPELRIALCAEQAPCGAAALTALRAAGVSAAPDTLERDVKAALTKVALGEVDAALVYRTDVKAAAGTVDGIDFPEAAQAVNDYPIATLADAGNATLAAAFVDFVLSPAGQDTLAAAGFQRP